VGSFGRACTNGHSAFAIPHLLDRVAADLEQVRVNVETLGYRSAFVAAVLSAFPGPSSVTGPARVVTDDT
jgi:hypothetical protein